MALGYKHVVPNLLRTGLRNFFSNLGEPLVLLNYMLQLKPGKAVETATRFVLNSTIGLGGAVDVAKSPAIRLPHRPNGLGDTLGYYGVGPGAGLVVPGRGAPPQPPPCPRPLARVPPPTTTGLDARAEADSDLRAILGDAVDPYATFRSVFLQDRAGEIADLHGPGWVAKDHRTAEPLVDPAAATGRGARELQSPLIDPAASPPVPQDAPAAAALTAGAPPTPSKARELQDPLTDPAAPATAPTPVQAPAPASTPN